MRRDLVHRHVIPGSRCGAVILAGILAGTLPFLSAAASVLTTAERSALAHEQFLENRRASITKLVNPYRGPAVAQIIEELPPPWKVRRNPWHYQIRASVFWVGEQPTVRNPVSNTASSWDPNWEDSSGA